MGRVSDHLEKVGRALLLRCLGLFQIGLVALIAVIALATLEIIERGMERLAPAIRMANVPLREGARVEPSERISQDPMVVCPKKLLAESTELARRGFP